MPFRGAYADFEGELLFKSICLKTDAFYKNDIAYLVVFRSEAEKNVWKTDGKYAFASEKHWKSRSFPFLLYRRKAALQSYFPRFRPIPFFTCFFYIKLYTSLNVSAAHLLPIVTTLTSISSNALNNSLA